MCALLSSNRIKAAVRWQSTIMMQHKCTVVIQFFRDGHPMMGGQETVEFCYHNYFSFLTQVRRIETFYPAQSRQYFIHADDPNGYLPYVLDYGTYNRYEPLDMIYMLVAQHNLRTAFRARRGLMGTYA